MAPASNGLETLSFEVARDAFGRTGATAPVVFAFNLILFLIRNVGASIICYERLRGVMK